MAHENLSNLQKHGETNAKNKRTKPHQRQVLYTCSDSRSPGLLQPLLLDNEASTNEKTRRQRENQTLDVVSGHALVGVSLLLPSSCHGYRTLTLKPRPRPQTSQTQPETLSFNCHGSRFTGNSVSRNSTRSLTPRRISNLRNRKS